MHQKIALFPLQLVAFPTEALNLHIFEARYRELIKDCEEHDIGFGVIAYAKDRVQSYGTLMKLQSIEKVYPDGKMDIKTIGTKLFKLEEFYNKLDECLYPGGMVEFLSNDMESDLIMISQLRNRLKQLYKIMRVDSKLPDDPNLNSYLIAHKIGLSLEQEYKLLQIFTEKKRLKYLLDHLDTVMPIAKEIEAMKEKIQMNGHFKHLVPPDLI